MSLCYIKGHLCYSHTWTVLRSQNPGKMEWDDIVYLTLLFSCIGFGHFLRQIKHKETRKWVATSFGFLVVLIASGRHILHPLFTVLVNSIIILFGNKRLVCFLSINVLSINVKPMPLVKPYCLR